MKSGVLPIALLLTWISAHAAQAQDRTSIMVNIDAAIARIDRETRCLAQKRASLEQISGLIRDARRQRDASPPASREYQDAEGVIATLAARARDTERQIAASCHAEPLVFGSDTSPEHTLPPATPRAQQLPPNTTVVVREPTAAERAVAEANPATRVIERAGSLSGRVQIVQGEQVDGSGQVTNEAIQSAFHSVGEPISRCYESSASRQRTGDLTAVFRVEESGRVSSIELEENTIGDTAMNVCVMTAFRRLRVREAVVGGHIVIAYTLSFGR